MSKKKAIVNPFNIPFNPLLNGPPPTFNGKVKYKPAAGKPTKKKK